MKELYQIFDYSDLNLSYYKRFIGIKERIYWFMKQIKTLGKPEQNYTLKYLNDRMLEEINTIVRTLVSEDNHSIRDNLGIYHTTLLYYYRKYQLPYQSEVICV